MVERAPVLTKRNAVIFVQIMQLVCFSALNGRTPYICLSMIEFDFHPRKKILQGPFKL